MTVKSSDTNMSELLTMVEDRKAQLPEFQRSWVWSDIKIRKLLESITSGFPMGAVMFLENGGENIRFKARAFTGVQTSNDVTPDVLVLDGQQRLTTLYQVFKSKDGVEIDGSKGKRFYYISIEQALNPDIDMIDAIYSFPENKKITENIGREIALDVSTPELEYQNMMFPLNIVFSDVDKMNWMIGFSSFYGNSADSMKKYSDFLTLIISPIMKYQLPVITIGKDMSRAGVCQIFENVNTGGVPLNVFELVTATFAAGDANNEGFNLREDWDKIKNKFGESNPNLLKYIDGTNFITAVTLFTTYKKSRAQKTAVTCKKRDVLKLELSDYLKNRDILICGFEEAAKFLIHQGVFSPENLPYTSQIIPLAAILAYDKENGNKMTLQTAREKLCKWYWSGVFGEMYGWATETRYALDLPEMIDWINGGEKIPDTINRANFQPSRLLSLQTRNSAAYKGIMALLLQKSPLDFMTGSKMDVATYLKESTDIHHVFPQVYCEAENYPKEKWNSIVNKTPIYASTNRSIGGRAPSLYIQTMKNKGLSDELVTEAISSHQIDFTLLNEDNFYEFIIDRAKRILNLVEEAIGKKLSGRDSEETIKAFGGSLASEDEKP